MEPEAWFLKQEGGGGGGVTPKMGHSLAGDGPVGRSSGVF